MKKKRKPVENLSAADHIQMLANADADRASRELTIRTYMDMGYTRAEAEEQVKPLD